MKVGRVMKCEHIKESLIEAAGGKLPAEAAAHVQTCASCATAWAEHQKLMTLLDEWKAPRRHRSSTRG